jgi:hypothetical protein
VESANNSSLDNNTTCYSSNSDGARRGEKINTENKEVKEKRRQRGCIFAIIGVPFTLWGVFWLLFAIYHAISDPGVPASAIFGCILFSIPGLLIGIPLLVFGIRWIIRNEKMPPANLGGLDNPQEEVKKLGGRG